MPATRTTYSLDPDTIEAIHSLARDWGLSQAGVVRRAVREARAHHPVRRTPQDAIAQLKAGSAPLSAAELDRIAADLRRAREAADAARP